MTISRDNGKCLRHGVNAPEGGASSNNHALPSCESVTDESRLTIFPFTIWRLDAKSCIIFRLGFPTITAITTSNVGATAVKLLRKGHTIAETKKVLAKSQSSVAEVNPSKLVQALLQAKFIKAIDGKQLSKVQPSRMRQMRQQVHVLGTRITELLITTGVRHLSAHWAYAVVHFFRWFALRSRRRMRVAAESNLAAAFDGLLPPSSMHTLAVDYCREKDARLLTRRFFRNMSEARVVRWIRQSTEIHGLENLAAARSSGRGVLLCGLHFTAAELLVAILWLHGQSFSGAGPAPPLRNKHVPTRLVLDASLFDTKIQGCGTLTWYSKASFDGAREILRTLSSAGTALVFLDGYPERPGKDVAHYFGHVAAEYSPGRTIVSFLNRSTSANTATAWMALQTNALVVPVKLLRMRGVRYAVMISPAIEFSAQDNVASATQKLYKCLESNICLHPAQWVYWDRLNELVVPGESQPAMRKPPANESTLETETWTR